MELLTNEGISHIASGVGILLFMDKATELRRMLSFAHVCVEVDLDSSLSLSVHMDIEDFGCNEITMEYPQRPKFCSICKELGHGNKNCPNSNKVWRPVQPKDKTIAFIPSESVNKAQALVKTAPPAHPPSEAAARATPDGSGSNASQSDTAKEATASLSLLSMCIHPMLLLP